MSKINIFKHREKITLFLIESLFIVYIVSFFNRPMGKFLESILPFVIFIEIVIIFITNKVHLSKKDIYFIIPYAALLLLSICLSVSGIGSYVNMVNIILIALISRNICLPKKYYTILIITTMILLVTLWYKSIFTWKNFQLNIDDDNPNVIAQGLVLTYTIIANWLSNTRNKTKRIVLSIVFTVLNGIAIYKCNCRTALIIYAASILIIYLPKLRTLTVKKYLPIIITVIILGAAFPITYMILYSNKVTISLPFIQTKNFFTGRERLWLNAIDSMNSSSFGYLIGMGTQNVTKMGVISNFHNWYIGMVYYFGIPLTLAFFTLLVYLLSKYKTDYIKVTILIIFLFGFTETSALWANSQFIILIALLMENSLFRREETDKLLTQKKELKNHE